MIKTTGFTLLELLIVIGIVAVLATVVFVVLNPVELLREARDAERLSELATINKAISLGILENSDLYLGAPNTVYISLPDASSTCANQSLPSLPGGWTYACVSTANLQKVDGSGWIPINFGSLKINPLSILPIDPINKANQGLYYTYVAGSWELNAQMESKVYQAGGGKDIVSNDGGNTTLLYEIGSSLSLVPSEISDRSAATSTPSFDFSLAVSPNSGSVIQGNSTSTTVTATLASGTTQSVSFSSTIAGSPSGVTTSFSPASCNPTCNSTMTINTTSGSPTGTYTVTITGTGGSLSRDTNYNLTIAASTSEPWLTGWSYRRPVTVDNTTSTLTNYQVLVTVDTAALITAGKMRSDCGDIRFTDSDKTTQLNYWLESGCNSASTKIWVKVPSIPGNQISTIYMYYGNPSASSASDGDTTFDFFDDFPGTSINTSKWNIVDSTGWSVANGLLKGLSTTGRLQSQTTFSNPIIQEVRSKVVTRATNGQQIAGFFVSTSNSFGLLSHPSSDYVRNDGGWTSLGAQYINLNVWYLIRISVKTSATVNLYAKNLDTGSDVYNSDFSNTVSSEAITIGKRYDDTFTGQAYEAYWDWIRVRKYTSPEPTTTVGNETTP